MWNQGGQRMTDEEKAEEYVRNKAGAKAYEDHKMIKDGIEYTKCPVCKRTCLKLEITSYGICKDCLIEKLKCCENCADYDGQDCNMDNENQCHCFTGIESDDCYWRLKED